MSNELPLPDAIHLNDAFGVFALGPDEVEFRTGTTSGRSFVASDSEQRGLLASIIEKIVSPQLVPMRPWNQAESEVLKELLPELQENGILDASVESQTANGTRGISAPILRKPLTEAKIGILGHGVLGHAIRLLLQRMGCRWITTVESSSVAAAGEKVALNLMGESPSPAALNSRRSAAPSDEQEWITTLRGHDWIIAAQDAFEPEELGALNRATFGVRVPWSLVCFDGYEGWVGPTFVPSETACFSCFQKRLFAGAAEPKHLFADPGIKVHRMPSPWSAGPEAYAWVSLIASLFAVEVVAAMNGRGFTLNQLLIVHRLNLTFQRESLLRLPRCPDCSPRRNAQNVNVFAHLLTTCSNPEKKR